MILEQFFPILHLPDEILINIFDYLDFQTLRDCITVCKNFDELAEPFLYHSIYILNGWQAPALSASLFANERRATWIRSLLVSTRFGEDAGLESLPSCIPLMRNLQELRLETPDCNSKNEDERVTWLNLQERYERVFGMASSVVPSGKRCLPSLKKCTLHFVDSRKEIYPMTKYPTLFLHPNLRSLTICCASTDFPDKLLVPFQNDPSLVKSTSLEYLHLEECDIHSPSLAILLSFPRALKSLKVSEGVRYDNIYHSEHSRLHGNVRPNSFVEAIAKYCRDSLEFLSLSLGHRRHEGQSIDHSNQHLNLTAFKNVKRLELDIRTTDLIRPRRCDHATWRRLPPNLETLRIFGYPLLLHQQFTQLTSYPLFPFELCFTRQKALHGIKNLSTLIFSYEYYREDEETPHLSTSEDGDSVEEINPVTEAQHRAVRECNKFQYSYNKAGVNLQIEMVVLPKGFIPPYLYQEESPRRYLLWESGRVSCRLCNKQLVSEDTETQAATRRIWTKDSDHGTWKAWRLLCLDLCRSCQYPTLSIFTGASSV